ncbi:Fe-S oxidoreductase [Spirochaetia bacterium]|nr:Fe-S oxidoreductase [Spirochaetia bacterium]
MEKRFIQKTGEELSLLGFGFMRLPLKEGTQEIDKTKALDMVDYAKDRGINYFDTAWMYHEGNSETFAGEALSRYDRSSFNLADKMPLMFVKAEADVERIFQEQLKKCKTDYFDYYLLHNIGKEHLKVAETFKIYEKLKEKQKQGQIRRLGFSFHDQPELLRDVVQRYDWDFAQIQLNYLDWEQQNAHEQYKTLEKKGIPVNVMEPVRGGTLANLCPESVLIFKNANPAASVASWAIRYAASLSGVQVVLSGMSTMDQVKDNIATMENFKPLVTEDYQVIDKALLAFKSAGTVPCTGCRYCMDCPQGIDIPKVLAIYNNYLSGKARKAPTYNFLFEMEYKILGEDKQAHHCVQCDECLEKCPQHINVSHWMKEIDKVHKENSPK